MRVPFAANALSAAYSVKINGREVHVVFKDDHYNPSYARQVCQQMAQQNHAFLLIGGAGTDQIKACAGYAASLMNLARR